MQQQFLIPHSIGKYSFIKEIEESKWSSVNQETNKEVFIQIIPKIDYQLNDPISKLARYNESMVSFQSNFFAKPIENFEDQEFYYFVFDKPEGISLNEYVARNKGKISEDYIKTFFKNLILAFKDMNSSDIQFSITYNNIYVTNCNVFNMNEFKLTIIPYFMKSTVNPTFIFEAPEVLLGKSKDMTSNVWTCGIFLYFITTGQLPFSVTPFNSLELQRLILNSQIKVPLYVPSGIKDLVIRMIVINPSARIGFHQIFDHVWLSREPLKQTAKTYSHIDMDQFPTLWAQPNFLKETPKDDFMRSHKVKVQVVSKQKIGRFHIEKIPKQ